MSKNLNNNKVYQVAHIKRRDIHCLTLLSKWLVCDSMTSKFTGELFQHVKHYNNYYEYY